MAKYFSDCFKPIFRVIFLFYRQQIGRIRSLYTYFIKDNMTLFVDHALDQAFINNSTVLQQKSMQ